MKRKIRVLRILNRFNIGGPVLNASYLTRHLGDDFESRLMGGENLAEEESAEFIPESMGLKPLIIPEMSRSVTLLSDYKAYRRIKLEINQFRPDIVHTHASKAGALGRLAARSCKVPVIIHTFHGHVFEKYFNSFLSAVVIRLERFLAMRCDAIIAISEQQKNDLVHRFAIAPADKVRLIPLGFDLDRFSTDQEKKREAFRQRYNIQNNQIAIGIIGRLAAVKNHGFFIDVFAKTRLKFPNTRAFIVGDGKLRNSLIKQCENAGLRTEGEYADVTFTSWITEVDEVVNGLDIICLTSHNEGTPVSLIEAAAAGKPVVSTEVGGVRDAVAPNGGVLVQPNELQGFIETLSHLISDRDKCKKMGLAGQVFVNEKYKLSRLIDDMTILYNDILNRKGVIKT